MDSAVSEGAGVDGASLPAITVVMIPSVSGGIGHISRTAALARALQRLDRGVRIEYLLDSERVRPFNIDATRRMGFRPRFLPTLTRENRDAIVRACLDHAYVIVDDCSRYLLPLRRAVPNVSWVTIAMHPVDDELFTDWPLMTHMDAVIWPYAALMELPPELDVVRDKVLQTGPFLETDDLPDRRTARIQLGLPAGDPFVLYAPRGFPFGKKFGHRVLAGMYGAVAALRQGSHANLRLVLLAVSDPADLRGIPGVPDTLPDWVGIKGVVTPEDALLYARAADVLVGEGTSTMHEGAALRTPLVLVPGPITEATTLAQALDREHAATVLSLKNAVPEALAAAFSAVLENSPKRNAMLDRAHRLVTGGGGAMAAAQLVLDLATARRAAARERTDLLNAVS